jgi:hypothetical protein
MRETFILLWPEAEGIESFVQVVEGMGGRVLLSFPPYAVVALLPAERIDELRTDPAIQLVSTEEISADMSVGLSSTSRMAADAWNEHLARQHDGPPKQLFEGLSWDAPGRLAPDPPAHIQEMLRRRERESQGDDG